MVGIFWIRRSVDHWLDRAVELGVEGVEGSDNGKFEQDNGEGDQNWNYERTFRFADCNKHELCDPLKTSQRLVKKKKVHVYGSRCRLCNCKLFVFALFLL